VILAAKGMGAATPTFISTKPNIMAVYPFKQAGIIEADVYRILDEAGLRLPSNLQRSSQRTKHRQAVERSLK
jgi:hypothetical protein